MTPFQHRVLAESRLENHATYERWLCAIIDATLEEAADQLDLVMMEIIGQRSNAAVLVRSLKTPETEPCE